MDSITAAAQRVLEERATDLADAKTTEAVEKLLPEIAGDIEKSFSPADDKFSYRAVIVILGIVVVIVAVTYAWYTLTPDTVAADGTLGKKLRDLPDALIALGSAAVGALAGLLAPSPRK